MSEKEKKGELAAIAAFVIGAIAIVVYWFYFRIITVPPAPPPSGTGTLNVNAVDTTTTNVALPGVSLAIAGLTALTDSQGNASIPNIPTGAQTLKATKLGYSTVSNPLTIVSGAQSQAVLMKQIPSQGVSQTFLILDGSKGNTPLSNISVELQGVGSLFTGSDGSVTFKNLAPNYYNVVVSPSGYTPFSELVQIPDLSVITITLTQIGGVEISNIVITLTGQKFIGRIATQYSFMITASNSDGSPANQQIQAFANGINVAYVAVTGGTGTFEVTEPNTVNVIVQCIASNGVQSNKVTV